LFSGATLPYEIMPLSLQRIADVLPLTQGIKLLKTTSLDMKLEMLPLLSMLVTAIIFTTLAVKYFKWE
jgi:ABC-2 type transport system permease protein